MSQSELLKDVFLKIYQLNQLTRLQCLAPISNSGTFALPTPEPVKDGEGNQ